MVLDDITDDAVAVKVAAAPLGAEILAENDLAIHGARELAEVA